MVRKGSLRCQRAIFGRKIVPWHNIRGAGIWGVTQGRSGNSHGRVVWPRVQLSGIQAGHVVWLRLAVERVMARWHDQGCNWVGSRQGTGCLWGWQWERSWKGRTWLRLPVMKVTQMWHGDSKKGTPESREIGRTVVLMRHKGHELIPADFIHTPLWKSAIVNDRHQMNIFAVLVFLEVSVRHKRRRGGDWNYNFLWKKKGGGERPFYCPAFSKFFVSFYQKSKPRSFPSPSVCVRARGCKRVSACKRVGFFFLALYIDKWQSGEEICAPLSCVRWMWKKVHQFNALQTQRSRWMPIGWRIELFFWKGLSS